MTALSFIFWRLEIANVRAYNLAVFILRTVFTVVTTECMLTYKCHYLLLVFISVKAQQIFDQMQIFSFRQQFVHGIVLSLHMYCRSVQIEGRSINFNEVLLLAMTICAQYFQCIFSASLISFMRTKINQIADWEEKWHQTLKGLKTGIAIVNSKDLGLKFYNQQLLESFGVQGPDVEDQIFKKTIILKYEKKQEEVIFRDFIQQYFKAIQFAQVGQSQPISNSLLSNLSSLIDSSGCLRFKCKATSRVVEVKCEQFAGEEDHVLLTASDITSAMKLEKQRQLQRMKTLYYCSVTHDLKTPINSIIATSTMLKEMLAKDERAKKLLQVNLTSCELLLKIVQDVIDLSKMELENFEIHKSWCDLGQLVQEVYELMKLPIEMKKLHFSYQIDPCLEDSLIFSEGKRIKQILFNLVNNALKFTFRGRIHIRVSSSRSRLSREGSPCRSIKFEVSDTGIGIKREDIDKLFKLFGKRNHDGDVSQTGIGLGLTICKRLSELLGGHICVESVQGVGTTFSFELECPVQEDSLRLSVSQEVVSDLQSNMMKLSDGQAPLFRVRSHL